jgi:hypothetical protein
LAEARYSRSLFEIKTVLQHNEIDDGRPIFFRKDHGYPNYYTVVGGKLDNIYDALDAIKNAEAGAPITIPVPSLAKGASAQ